MILTVNTGSTSAKLSAFESGALRLVHQAHHSGAKLDAASLLIDFMRELRGELIEAVAHRVVHGSTRFKGAIRIDDTAVAEIAQLNELAPLHNPPALRWIAAAREILPATVVHVAMFDTAFFRNLPQVAAHYAIPETVGSALGVRRYGFHGLAHSAMWERWHELNPQLPAGGRLITLQLGGGCSIAAIAEGKPLDTSMGFSPLEGLVMATRSGDIDPAAIPFLEKRLGIPGEKVIQMLNLESGLKGISGVSGNLSELLDHSADASRLAVDMYCYRARKYVGAFLAVLGGCDGIVFSGGVGEHVSEVREQILRGLEWAGIELDRDANARATGGEAQINSVTSHSQVRVLPADEALVLAKSAASVMKKA